MLLSATQRLILGAAAKHPDGISAPPPNLPPAPRAMVAKALLRAGLLTLAEAGHYDPGADWKLDGAPAVLRITETGLQAMGVEEPGMPAQPGDVVPDALAAALSDDAATTVPTDRHSESLAPLGAICVVGAAQPTEAAQGVSQAARGPSPPPSLRDAARTVLTAWDAPDQPGLAAALETLRTALPTGVPAQRSTGPRQPRPDTKQAAVLALLRRPEGASGPALAAATGWAPHTVRGFLAGLTRKGLAVTVLERIRQAGPNQAGARGSYSIYRIAEAS